MFPGETVLSGADLGGRTFQVCRSAAGFYIGTQGMDGPYSRESGYFSTEEDAQRLLDEWVAAVNIQGEDDNATSITAYNVRAAREAYLNDALAGARA